MTPDSDLLIDVHLEIDKRPHATGAALLKEYLTAVYACNGRVYSINRVQECARRLRVFLRNRKDERSERVPREPRKELDW